MRVLSFVGLVSVAAVLLAACSSSPSAAVESQDASTDGDASDANAVVVDAGTDAPRTERECAAKPDANSCVDCCTAYHERGSRIFFETLRRCRCAPSPGGCATECNDTYCATPSTTPSKGDACSVCMAEHAEDKKFCADELDAVCAPVVDCSRLNECLNRCPKE